MKLPLVHPRLWFTSCLVSSMALGAATITISVIQSVPKLALASALEKGMLLASGGGVLGTLKYRISLSLHETSRETVNACGLAFIWSLLLLLMLVVVDNSFNPLPALPMPIYQQVIVAIGLSLATTSLGFFPLELLRDTKN